MHRQKCTGTQHRRGMPCPARPGPGARAAVPEVPPRANLRLVRIAQLLQLEPQGLVRALRQGLTLAHFKAQHERFVCGKGCA
jgi:hypothetical protein